VANFILDTRMRDTKKPRLDSEEYHGAGGIPYWRTYYAEAQAAEALRDFLNAIENEHYASLQWTAYVS
jgi:hypothetical protein